MKSSFSVVCSIVGFVFACGPSYPNCNTDENCHEQEHCVNSRCQACAEDSHCTTGQRCNAGACEAIPGFCNTTITCPSGEACVQGRCAASSVVTRTNNETTPASACELQSVYYSFDDSNLDQAARTALEANGHCIQERAYTSVIITGSTDPRGTEEYNLALGDRRARAAADHLQRLGSTATAQVRSMGEETATGEDESGWSRDRRAEFRTQ